MRLTLDPAMYYGTHSVLELPDKAASLGFEWIEISPKDDFVPFFGQPRIDSAGVAALRKRLGDAGVGISSILPLQRWAGPDEDHRRAAVRAWRRTIQIAVDLGVTVLNSEFNGRPEDPETAEAAWVRSIDELLPLIEAEGLTLVLEPHPDDFIEDGVAAVHALRGLDSSSVKFQYCLPHTFHMGGDASRIIAAAGPDVVSVHVADAFDHTINNGLRYIVNPPGSTARVHQHMEIGRGDVDFDTAFAALAAVGFDGSISASVFGWDEVADEVNVRMIEKIRGLVDTHFDAATWESPRG
ncbi:sugar phosphate isomerase/epimerase family protein [Solicola sp. PLA-1-18]|uniref:sugar phosphate isomerase/epimerase family protein n=1 Tax=Solicola sp. PLA-1-18 TaxID=3380532 RepID=UPI003B81FA57